MKREHPVLPFERVQCPGLHPGPLGGGAQPIPCGSLGEGPSLAPGRDSGGGIGGPGDPGGPVSPVSLLKDLKHANIVTLHDLIHTDRSLTLVFEYLVSWTGAGSLFPCGG